jgi:hypothetical protein
VAEVWKEMAGARAKEMWVITAVGVEVKRMVSTI